MAATQVYTEEDVVLQDGTEITLRPSPVGVLRRIMAAWKAFEDLKEEEESFDIFINCSGIALEKHFKDKFDETKADPKNPKEKGEVLNAAYKAYLEDTLDMDTIYKIMDVCAGMKLSDPNLLAAATTRALEDGTT